MEYQERRSSGGGDGARLFYRFLACPPCSGKDWTVVSAQMISEVPEDEPSRRQWIGFWCMILQQTQNAFNDKLAQFTLIPLGGAVAFAFLIPVGAGIKLDVPSVAGLLMALPFVIFAPIAGWLSDRYSKRDVMLGSAVLQVLVIAAICGAVMMKNMPIALCGFFALAVQSAFFSPAKFGINKELIGSKYLGFAAGIQQMTAMLAILAGQIFAGWLFDHRLMILGGGAEVAWKAALMPLLLLGGLSIPALGLAWLIPRVPAQGCPKFTARLTVSHFINLAGLWRDVPLRRASFGVAFFWGFAAFINLWSVKLAEVMTGGGEGFGTQSSVFMASASLGMAGGFGVASFLLRKRIELGWVPVAGFAMALMAFALAFIAPGDWVFLTVLAFLAFFAAIFLAPLNAWMQDRYPAAKRGELQSAVNLQDCFAGILAVIVIGIFEYVTRALSINPLLGFRYEIAFIGLVCGFMTLSILRLLPADFIRLFGGAFIRAAYRIRVLNVDHIPVKGGALILPNHVTFADAFFIYSVCPRPVRFVMDEAFMEKRSIRMFVKIFDTVTIRRDQPLEAIRETINALKNGDLVCLFPEGQLTRTGTLSELQRGFELIAKKTGHSMLPMWCDGSWGSIFSFERGRFIRKRPYRMKEGMTIAFGEEIVPQEVKLEQVRDGLLGASALAISARFTAPEWGQKIPDRNSSNFRIFSEAQRRRLWVNGYQIGQVNALQRRQLFHSFINDDSFNLPGLVFCFTELFDAELYPSDRLFSGKWIGGDRLRRGLLSNSSLNEIEFYDFGTQALTPLEVPGVLHLPCLAMDGIVISMSMPHPPKNEDGDEIQPGHKRDTWGKLLPGFFVRSGRVFGPSTPAEGIPLPDGAWLDGESFLCAKQLKFLFRAGGWQNRQADRV